MKFWQDKILKELALVKTSAFSFSRKKQPLLWNKLYYQGVRIMGVITAVVAHHLMTVGYLTIVKSVIDHADKKVNQKKETK